MRRRVILVVALIGVTACAPRDDPGRTALRTRLTEETQLSSEEIAHVFEQVQRSLQGKPIRIARGATKTDLGASERDVVLGMLNDRTGVFDEGLRTGGGRRARVFNAPGASNNPEIEASRRLFVDVETFLPLRFEFAYAYPNPDDYSLDLIIE